MGWDIQVTIAPNHDGILDADPYATPVVQYN